MADEVIGNFRVRDAVVFVFSRLIDKFGWRRCRCDDEMAILTGIFERFDDSEKGNFRRASIQLTGLLVKRNEFETTPV